MKFVSLGAHAAGTRTESRTCKRRTVFKLVLELNRLWYLLKSWRVRHFVTSTCLFACCSVNSFFIFLSGLLFVDMSDLVTGAMDSEQSCYFGNSFLTSLSGEA